MSKGDFLKIIETLDIAKIIYFNIRYEDYTIDSKENELNFNND